MYFNSLLQQREHIYKKLSQSSRKTYRRSQHSPVVSARYNVSAVVRDQVRFKLTLDTEWLTQNH